MNASELAAEHGLHRVGARPPLGTYLKQTWARRDFAAQLAKSRIAAANEANRLGRVWEVLKPTLNALIYGFIFGVIQASSSRGPNYAAFVVIGVFLFEFFASSMSQGAKSITGNRSLVQSLNFPRMTLPVSVVLQQLYTLGPMLLVMCLYVWILGEPPAWSWLLLIPLVAIYTCFNLGVALIFARLTVHLRDLTQLIPFITRLLMYTSGVLFMVDKIFAGHPWIERLYNFHPVYLVIEIARNALMHEHPVPGIHWLTLSIISVVVLVFGVVFFWKAEERYGRVS